MGSDEIQGSREDRDQGLGDRFRARAIESKIFREPMI